MKTEEKTYDTALKLARDYYEDKNCFKYLKGVLENIFPELKESKDEKIRKMIINHLTQERGSLSNEDTADAIAWLEKQGKKPTLRERYKNIGKSEWFKKTHEGMSVSEEEPNFHEGDWIVYKNEVCQIVKHEEGCNKLVTVFGIEKELVNERNLSTARLWTIQDAKDGDVLVSSFDIFDIPFIYNGNYNSDYIGAYCGITTEGDFSVSTEKCRWSGNKNIHPASKIQCDLLFVKMHEAGFEWNAEKKELRKIAQSELTEFEDAVKDMMNAYRDAIGANDVTTEEIKKHAKYLLSLIPHKPIEQKLSNSENIGKNEKPMWTDEDEKRLQSCIITLQGKGLMGGVDTIDTKWLKSLKQKMEEQ